jgi:hypothetical protein
MGWFGCGPVYVPMSAGIREDKTETHADMSIGRMTTFSTQIRLGIDRPRTCSWPSVPLDHADVPFFYPREHVQTTTVP